MNLLQFEKTVSCRVVLVGVIAVSMMLPMAKATADTRVQRGIASWHEPRRGSSRTASHRAWVGAEMIAAHRTLPLGSKVRVTNLANGRSAVVEIRDRGPYGRGRIIDVSRCAAKTLGLLESGTARVKLEVVSADAASS